MARRSIGSLPHWDDWTGTCCGGHQIRRHAQLGALLQGRAEQGHPRDRELLG